MAWHLGYPLSQTILTSVYVEAFLRDPNAPLSSMTFLRDSASQAKQPKFLFVLRAYCAGMLRGCHCVNEVVKDELYYEVCHHVTLLGHRFMQARADRDTGGRLCHQHLRPQFLVAH